MMIVDILKGMLRPLQLQSSSPRLLTMALRRVLMIPPLVVLALYFVIHTRVFGPLHREANTFFGSRFSCQLPDFIPLYIYLFGIWEPDITEFVQRRLKPGDVFVDVGANIGYHTVLASKIVGDTGRVVAIEASPKIFDLLQANVSLNGHCRNVSAVNMGASASSGTLKVYEGPSFSLGLTSTIDQSGRRAADAEVAAASLDDMLEDILADEEWECLRMVKIDVEGGEEAVIAGMNRMILQCPADTEFLIEITPQFWKDPQKRAEEVLQKFFDAGFVAYRIPNSYLPGRYLWPFRTCNPQRIIEPISSPLGQLDLILSRRDACEL